MMLKNKQYKNRIIQILWVLRRSSIPSSALSRTFSERVKNKKGMLKTLSVYTQTGLIKTRPT